MLAWLKWTLPESDSIVLHSYTVGLLRDNRSGG